MEQPPHLSELAPVLRRVDRHPPPLGKKIYMVSKYGVGVIGVWNRDCLSTFVGWCPLPRWSDEDKKEMGL